MKKSLMTALLLSLLLVCGCSAADKNSSKEKDTANIEKMDFSNEPENVIYLAGGCFWGIEKLMQSIPGVTDTESGYA
ncbi:MAG: peptide-methionine (S)-S-oxide reductase, partial [Clostridia bacterium]